MIRVILSLILVGITYGQLSYDPIISCEDATSVLMNLGACGTAWNSVRGKILARMPITANEANILCDAAETQIVCTHTILQMINRCEENVTVSSAAVTNGSDLLLLRIPSKKQIARLARSLHENVPFLARIMSLFL